MTASDLELLRQYALRGAEEAFAELVKRHASLVYSTALRKTGGDVHQAKDITQLVFTQLAKKAGFLRKDVVVAGWLHRATVLTAAQTRRAEARRHMREKEMLDTSSEPAVVNPSWGEMAPILDQLLLKLKPRDREALLLRYFEEQSLKQIGDVLGCGESGASQCIARALEKLRLLLNRHGIKCSTGLLAANLSANAIQGIPAMLLAGLAASSLLNAAAAGVSTTGFAAAFTMTKFKIGAVSALILVGVSTPFILQYKSLVKLRNENSALKTQLESRDPLPAGELRNAEQEPARTSDFHELMRLRGRIGLMNREITDLRNALALAAGGETERQANPSDQRIAAAPTGYYPAESWGNFGYTTPEATAITFFWALRNAENAAYSGALGKSMPPINEEGDWAVSLKTVKGSFITSVAESPGGELVANITHETNNGEFLDSLLTYRQENGQWMIKKLAGFPIRMFEPVPAATTRTD